MTLEAVCEKAHADLLGEWLWCVTLRGKALLCDLSNIFNLQNTSFLSGTTDWICAAYFQFIQRWHIVGSLLFINARSLFKNDPLDIKASDWIHVKIKLFGTLNKPFWKKKIFGFAVLLLLEYYLQYFCVQKPRTTITQSQNVCKNTYGQKVLPFHIFFFYITACWRRQDTDILIIKCHILLELISACCIGVERLFENLICQQLSADVLQHRRQPRITYKAAVCSGKDERRRRKMGEFAPER